MNKLKQYKYTIVTSVIAALFYLFVLLTNADIMEHIMSFLQKYERFELNELLIAGFIISMGIIADISLHKIEKEYSLKLNEQRLQVLRSTTRSLQDIINNMIVGLQFLRINAEENDCLDKEALDMIDTLVSKTTLKINTLGNLENASERELYAGLSIIDFDDPGAPKK